jgi:hypothetical protein
MQGINQRSIKKYIPKVVVVTMDPDNHLLLKMDTFGIANYEDYFTTGFVMLPKDDQFGVYSAASFKEGEIVCVSHPRIIYKTEPGESVNFCLTLLADCLFLLCKCHKELLSQLYPRDLSQMPIEHIEEIRKEKKNNPAFSGFSKEDIDSYMLLFFKLMKNVFCDSNGFYQVYVSLSFINHGCSPNAIMQRKSPLSCCEVILTKDVEKGEQICIEYCDPSDKKNLETILGGPCQCSICKK